jgi:hypothetical protein
MIGADGRWYAAAEEAVSDAGLAGPAPELGDDMGRVGCGAGDDGIDGRGVIVTVPSPKKSFTRVSTSWLIEMLLASQNAFSRS